jgi:hypothetical protein
MSSNVQKSFQPTSKDIRYLNRDFSQLRTALINFSKTYYPNTYKDFSSASPGMMFMEQAAYVGDVLSYYTDYAFKEGLMLSASERKNIISLVGYLGYKVKPSRASTGVLDIYQLCPSTDDGMGNYFPDPNYMLLVKENSQFSNNAGSYYILTSAVDFTISSSFSTRVDTVYSRNQDGTPQFFLLQKEGTISAGQVFTKEVIISDPVPFYQIALDETNVLGILTVIDSDNNNWYETDYMAQELVPISVPNDAEYEGSLQNYKDSVPYIMNYLKTSRRFITTVDENNITTLQFGAGINGVDDELVTFDSALIGVGLSNISNVNVPLDPSNFLNNENYGIAPQNTTLTITYLVGGGLASNCQSDEIKNVVQAIFDNSSEGLLPEQTDLLNTVINSLQVSNSEPCVGGKDAETNDEIKMNAMANFAAQSRCVTQSDYLVRIYSLPAKYGSVAKAQIVSNTSLQVGVGNKIMVGVVDQNNVASLSSNANASGNFFRGITYDTTNPFSINVYILSYDANKNLTTPNDALITNMITYLKQYRMLTDAINIIDGYIINIGVDFTITVYKGFNKKDVLLSCIQAVQSFFNIDNWNFSQPISISQLNLEIAKVNGVQSVVNIDIFNKTVLDGNYSSIQYDIVSATKNGVIYPSVDPSIFEVKYLDSDIMGSTL